MLRTPNGCVAARDAFCTKSASTTKVGWTVGGGVEHMWDKHWTVGLEGLFVDLGSNTVSNASPGCTGSNCANKNSKFTNQLIIGRFKLNYKF